MLEIFGKRINIDIIFQKKIFFTIATVLLILTFIVGTAIILYMNNETRLRLRDARFDLSEYYFKQGEYTSSELLCVSLLSEYPEYTRALQLIEKIHSKKNISLHVDMDGIMHRESYDIASLIKKLDELDTISALLVKLEQQKNEYTIVTKTEGRESKNGNESKKENAPGLKDETTLGVYLARGIQAYKAGSYGDAKEYFLKALDIDNSEPTANSLLASMLLSENPQDTKNLIKVIGYGKKAINADINNKIAYVTVGKAYECQNSWDLALSNYLEALRIDQNDGEVCFSIGKLYAELGNLISSEHYLKQAISRKRELPFAYYQLSLIENKNGHSEQAITYLEQSVAFDNNFYSGYAELGELYFEKKQYGQAMKCFLAARSLHGNFINSTRIADCSLYLGNAGDAEREYMGALKNYPPQNIEEKKKGAEVYEFLSGRAFENGEIERAADLATIGLALNGKSIGLNLLLGKYEKINGMFERAIKYFNDAITSGDTSADTCYELSKTYFEAGKKEQAIDTLERAIKIKPELTGTEDYKKYSGLLRI